MSKLRASISFQDRIDEVKNIQQKKSKENIAEPIIPIIIDSNEENPINLEDPTNIQEDNSEGDEEENDEYLLAHLKQTNEQVLKMMEHGRNSRELEYIRIYREDEYKFLEFAVEDFTRKRDALMADDVVRRFIINDNE